MYVTGWDLAVNGSHAQLPSTLCLHVQLLPLTLKSTLILLAYGKDVVLCEQCAQAEF